MTSKMNKNHDDSATLSFSSAHSPYNLRRNQSQSGGVTKEIVHYDQRKIFIMLMLEHQILAQAQQRQVLHPINSNHHQVMTKKLLITIMQMILNCLMMNQKL
ncbi:unnamed protein product [Rotaria socialis]|uniref:Uncharacterized protein n=1 Tax=Rotaria socialis TaxID=392032 RepID=A0A817SW79_9BILA|nr:unnamed protein product [Rotaria socialis]